MIMMIMMMMMVMMTIMIKRTGYLKCEFIEKYR